MNVLSNSKYCSKIYQNDVLHEYKDSLSNIYQNLPNGRKIKYKNINSNKIEIFPLYINKLGNTEDKNASNEF